MYSNYEEERNLRQLQIILEKKEIFDKLKKEKMIDKDKKEPLINSLRDGIDEIIEKKKEKE